MTTSVKNRRRGAQRRRGLTFRAVHWFKPGSRVRLKNNPRAGVATVESVYRDIPGGRRLDRELDGFYSWNVEALRLA